MALQSCFRCEEPVLGHGEWTTYARRGVDVMALQSCFRCEEPVLGHGEWTTYARRGVDVMALQSCFRCEEPVLGHGEWTTYCDGKTGHRVVQHYECAMRSLIGGLNHLRGRCTCCGGNEDPDPPEMTRREAAIAAVRYWEQSQHLGQQI